MPRPGALAARLRGAFRRSEFVALDVEDLRFPDAGLYVWIAAAKNDPRKAGRELYVPPLPADAGWRRSGSRDPSFGPSICAGGWTESRHDPGDVSSGQPGSDRARSRSTTLRPRRSTTSRRRSKSLDRGAG